MARSKEEALESAAALLEEGGQRLLSMQCLEALARLRNTPATTGDGLIKHADAEPNAVAEFWAFATSTALGCGALRVILAHLDTPETFLLRGASEQLYHEVSRLSLRLDFQGQHCRPVSTKYASKYISISGPIGDLIRPFESVEELNLAGCLFVQGG